MSGSLTTTTASLATVLIAGRPRRWALELAAVAGGVLAVALLSKASVPMFPVPVTGQTLGVLLVGAAFGARRGTLTMSTYLVAGLAGLPVFAGATAGPLSVLSPSFGYIIGFIPAAWIIGTLSDRGGDRSLWRSAIAAVSASIAPFLIGVPYMSLILAAAGTAPTLEQALAWGVWPFLAGGAIKAAIAAIALPTAWRIHDLLSNRRKKENR